MGAGLVVLVMAFGGLFVWLSTVAASVRQERHNKLAQIAARLEGSHTTNVARGKYLALDVSYRFADRGSGSTVDRWTEVDVVIPQGYPLALHVRRHRSGDRARIANATMVDVEVGDPSFDPLFLVEAAPADIARSLLDPETRGFLASHGEVELDTVQEGGVRLLRLSLHGWFEEQAEAMQAVAAVTHIASRIRETFAAADEVIQAVVQGAPYRPVVDETPTRDAAEAREREVARVDALRAERMSGDRLATLFFGLLLLFVSIAVIGTCNSGGNHY
jgi:hypothetical protein